MGQRDPRIDAYIARSATFARPILRRIRTVVHAACPGVEETIKWGFPHFMSKGMLCSMASFKAHCAFGFWNERLMADRIRAAAGSGGPGRRARTAMGQFGRLASPSDLPDDRTLARLVKVAAAINEKGIRRPKQARPKKIRRLAVPAYFKTALRRNRRALATFEGFTYTNKKDYVEWITEAKQDATRHRRLATAVAWMAQGKPRNWKYMGR